MGFSEKFKFLFSDLSGDLNLFLVIIQAHSAEIRLFFRGMFKKPNLWVLTTLQSSWET